MNGKTRDLYDVRAILNEKTRHCHGRDSANPVKMQSKITCASANHVKMHTQNPTRVQIQGAVKAEGLQHKENPGPLPLPGKMHSKLTCLSANPVNMHAKNPPRPLYQGAVKAEGLPDKENPGPAPLPGKSSRVCLI